MDIAQHSPERSRIILVFLTLGVIGLALIASTWQTMEQQHAVEEQHLFLSARAMLLSMENSLSRSPTRSNEALTARTSEIVQFLRESGDLLFAGIVDAKGGRLLTPPGAGGEPIELPAAMVQELREDGEWHGRLTLSTGPVYVYGKRLPPVRPMHMSIHEDPAKLPTYLVVGMDADRHLGAYEGFRHSALFQAVYILAAALFTWSLGASLISRREQARRTAALERFQVKLLDNLPDGLITLDATLHIRAVNPAALAIVEERPENLVGSPASVLPEKIAAFLPASVNHISAWTGTSGWQQVRHNSLYLEILTLPLKEDKENAFLLIIRDRTRLNRLEKSLAQAEKLAAIGTLAAGVAHEVRNPLSSLRGFAQYFVKKLKGRRPEEDYAKTMVQEADRLNRVITDLLFLARPREALPGEVALAPLVRDIAMLLRFDLERKGVELVSHFAAPTLYADEDALKQALLNLVLNSLHALPDNAPGPGRQAVQIPLMPGLEPEPGTPAPGAPPLALASGYTETGVWIEVRDQGCGMSETMRDRAFEAFFTGRENGTGLGLALVQRTMQDHDGTAGILSSPGSGCTVRLEFPAPPDTAGAAAFQETP